MKKQIRDGLAGLLTAGAFGLGSLIGYEGNQKQTSRLQTSAYAFNQNEGIILKEVYEFKKPKYHPSIEDFEKQLEREITPLVPTYYEFGGAFNAFGLFEDVREPLKKKFLKIRENPKSVQNNKYYKEFLKHFEYYYKNPNKKGFLFYDKSVYDHINDNRQNDLLKKNLGFNVDFRKPSEVDKSTMFLFWLLTEKTEKISANNKKLFYWVLDKINGSGRMPTIDYKNKNFINEYESSVNYGFLLKDSLGDEKTDIDKARAIIASSYNDSNNDGKISIDEINFDDIFDLKKNKEMILGMHLPKRTEKTKTGTIELYNPRGEKIVESNFEIDNNLKKGEVNLERIVRDSGFGFYNVAFFVNGKCWQVQQIETDFDDRVKMLLEILNKINWENVKF